MYRTLMCKYMMYMGCMYVNNDDDDDDDDDGEIQFTSCFHVFAQKKTH